MLNFDDEIYSNALINLENAYKKLSWWKRLFFPSPLIDALREFIVYRNNQNALNFYNAFFRLERYFYGKWIISSLSTYLSSFLKHEFTQTIRKMHDYGLLNGKELVANFEHVVKAKNSWYVVDAFNLFHQNKLLEGNEAQANREAVVNTDFPIVVAKTVLMLNRTGLLTGEKAKANRLAFTSKANSRDVNSALWIMNCDGLLSDSYAQANFDAVIKALNPEQAAYALVILHWKKSLNNEPAYTDREVAIKAVDSNVINAVKEAFAILWYEYNGYSQREESEKAQSIRMAVVNATNPSGFAHVISMLKQRGGGIFRLYYNDSELWEGEQSQSNYEELAKAVDPKAMWEALGIMNEFKLLEGSLAQTNRDLLVNAPNQVSVLKALQILNNSKSRGWLTQANFEALVKATNPMAFVNAIAVLHNSH
jgi:hypothetical protein